MATAYETVTIIGSGVIGTSWAARFAASGHTVRMNDVMEGFEKGVKHHLEAMLPQITDDVAEATGRISFHNDFSEALQGATVVQENGPEKAEFKQKMFADLEAIVGSDTLIVSSSSGIPPEVIGEKMNDPKRAIIGHPFNPPHLIPLVEVCAHPSSDDEMVNKVMDFYRSADKHPVRLKRPIPGFVANRLQMALTREAINIVGEGVVEVDELDEIMLNSLGIRWASIGPLLTGQLGAGDAGLVAMIDKIASSLFAAMGLPPVDQPTLKMLGEQTDASYPRDAIASLEEVRDARQVGIMDIQQKNPLPKA